MRYQTFHVSRQGASHLKRGTPCQDASAEAEFQGVGIAVVSDGHGHRRHFRSQRGAELAVSVALSQIEDTLGDPERMRLPMDERLDILKRRICAQWRAAVAEDLAQNPWTLEELKEQAELLDDEQLARLMDGVEALLPYGCTLLAVYGCACGWEAVQLGDGGLVRIGADGAFDWPMPPSSVNQGHFTASLCQSDPMMDFRHCGGDDVPAGLVVYTDGVDKVYPEESREIVEVLHWVWQTAHGAPPERDAALEDRLDALTAASPIGDDVSVAGLVDLDIPEIAPKPTLTQCVQEMARLRAELDEAVSALEYNRQMLERARRGGVGADTTQRLAQVVSRKYAEINDLSARARDLRRRVAELERAPVNPVK